MGVYAGFNEIIHDTVSWLRDREKEKERKRMYWTLGWIYLSSDY